MNFYIHNMNDKLNLRQLDLNLLVVFDAVFHERHVTRAAEKLGMSQPAVSNALQRLRDALQDDLLIKTPQGMDATERALELAGPVRGVISELEDVLSGRPFDPLTARGVITLATVDYFNVVLLPKLVEFLSHKAPNLSLRIVPTNGESQRLLEVGQADLALASFGTFPNQFEKLTLIQEGYVCVFRRDHPLVNAELDAEKYAELRHVLHSPGGDLLGSTDSALAKLGLKRQIAVTVSSFLHAEAILLSTDMIMTAPCSVAAQLTKDSSLSTLPCPVEVDESAQRLDLLWHRRFGKRPIVEWLRATIVDLARMAPSALF